MSFYDYKCDNCGIFEIEQSIKDDAYTECPKCGSESIIRLISAPAAFIYKGRQANTYNDCKGARTWRDKNGNLHKVSSSDGSYKSPTTTSKQYRSKEQVEAMKNRDAKLRKMQRQKASYQRFERSVRKKSK